MLSCIFVFVLQIQNQTWESHLCYRILHFLLSASQEKQEFGELESLVQGFQASTIKGITRLDLVSLINLISWWQNQWYGGHHARTSQLPHLLDCHLSVKKWKWNARNIIYTDTDRIEGARIGISEKLNSWCTGPVLFSWTGAVELWCFSHLENNFE